MKAAAGPGAAERASVLTGLAPRRRRLGRWRLLFGVPANLTGAIIAGLFLLLSAIGAVWTPGSAVNGSLTDVLQAPSSAHPFGTDDLGRDILSRVLAGAHLELEVALIVLLVAGILGIVLGLLTGYLGGWFDEVVMRVTDIFLGFPALLFAVMLGAALGPSLGHAILAMSVVWWPWYARILRGQVIKLRHDQFVEAAYAIGASRWRIMVKHILPNTIQALLIQATLDVGSAILTAATLGFVGLGAQPPSPEWGAMVAEGQQYVLSQWWVSVFPGLAIMIVSIGFSLLGDGLRDVLDPALSPYAK